MSNQYNQIDMEESLSDSDYATFLRSSQQYGYGHDYDYDYDSDKGEARDLDYEMFLENLKPNGESYLAEIKLSSGLLVMLRYEEEEEEYLENVERNGNFESQSKRVRAKAPDYSGGFLRTVKTDLRRIKVKVPENLGGFSRNEMAEASRSMKNVLKIGRKRRKGRVRNVHSEERKSAVDENKVKKEAEDDSVPCKSSGEPSKKMSLVMVDESLEEYVNSLSNRVPCKSSGEALKQTSVVPVDESWVEYVNSLSFSNPRQKMVVGNESDHEGRHRMDDESSSDLEILALDNIPFHEGGYTSFVPSKSYQSLPGEEGWVGIKNSSQSKFREKLMDHLKKPFDREEFERLWHEVNDKKPVEGVRDLRNGRMKSYSTKTDGKSYLDHFNELKKKINGFIDRPDRPKILYLLRGFFFWLENIAHDGAFQPWLDSSILSDLDRL